MDKKNKQSTHENKDVSEVKEEIDILKNKAEKLNDLLDMLDDNMFDEWDNINQRVEDKTKDFSAIDVEKLHLPKIDLPSQPQKKTELVEPKGEVEKQQAKQNNDVKTEVKNTNKSKADFQSKPQKKTKLVQSKADVKKEQTKQNVQVKTEVKNVSKKNKRPHFKSPLSQNKTAFTGFYEKIVGVKRISKTTKGGRNMRFSALAVIGDKNGLVGFGKGKSIEVPVAIKKALKDAKNNLVKVKITKNGSLFHEVIGKQGAGKVLIKPAPEGTGIIAGGPIRVVLELAGYKDIYSKNLGKNTSINMVRASINGLLEQKTPKEIAFLRDKKLTNL